MFLGLSLFTPVYANPVSAVPEFLNGLKNLG
jgi:hypothetical protein